MRNPLDKESFLQGNRQKWFAVLIFFMVVILICDSNYDVDAAAYLNFLGVTGGVFLLGKSADSIYKIKAADRKQANHQEEPL